VVFIFPTYLFVVTLCTVLAMGVIKTLVSHGSPTPVVTLPQLPAAAGAASLWLLLQSFASGCTAMTGVEAISNGVTAFREPRAVRAQRTLTAVILILIVLLAGIAYLVRAYGIGATEPGREGYQSVLSQLVAAVVGRGVFYYVTIAGILSVLALSANTGFADFPRLCRVIAQDGYLPHVRLTRAAARLLGRYLRIDHARRPAADHLRRRYRQTNPALRCWRLLSLHPLASRDGRPLAANGRCASMA
jgi:amino acid transporter